MSKPPSRLNTYSEAQTSVRENTSYGIQRTLPSPTDSLTPSTLNSASNSSSSPPEPTTPPRASRSRTRYPDLGRVPLHRRGTSKTYERLEDLLKEAGYKETRVFTPETELLDANRHDGERDANADKRLSTMKEGMGAVVGFLAGLMPGGNQIKGNPLPSSHDGPDLHNTFVPPAHEYSPPISPLASRTLQKQSSIDLTEPPTPTTMTSSNDSLGDLTPKAASQQSSNYAPTITISHTHPQYYQHHQQRPPFLHRTSSQLSSQQMHKQPSRSSLHRQAQLQANASNEIAAPLPSRSAAHLRHVASTQSMPPSRPSSTPTHQLSRPSLHGHDSDPENLVTRGTQPPLPTTWLESVARAVLFGGTGAHVGGPSSFLPAGPSVSMKGSSSKAKLQALRHTRSSLSQTSLQRDKHHRSRTPRSGLSDQTNTQGSSSRALAPPPHPLFSKVERGRAGRIEGEVSKTRVVCRSAPGSRASSLVRSGPSKEEGKEKWIPLGHERGRNKRRRDEKNRVPSLARTQVEGDVWDQERRRRKSQKRTSAGGSRAENRYLSGWGADAESEGDDAAAMEGTTSGEDDEEDEGELNLARILVHPKRQHSIKSLRKHLSAQEAGTGSGKSVTATARSGLGMNLGPGQAPVVSGPKRSGVPSILQRRPTQEDWDGESQEEWGGGWVRKNRGGCGSDDDEVERFAGFFGEGRAHGSGRSHTGKSRLGFNGAWGLIGGGGGS